VVPEVGDGAAAVVAVRETSPDVVLMDIRMPTMDGLAATRQITSDPATAASRVVILTTFDLDDYVYEALRAGATGFLLKDTLPNDLLTAIRVVAAGDALIAPATPAVSSRSSLDAPSRARRRTNRSVPSPTVRLRYSDSSPKVSRTPCWPTSCS
jgi:DNA-binding NarL/FixJ family response regulator